MILLKKIISKIKDIEDKLPNIVNLATNTTLNGKINEVENKIPNTTNLTTTPALTAVGNKIPDHSKYITTPEFNKLVAENFAVRLAQANLASKNDIANFLKKANFDDKLKSLNKKYTSNKTKHVLVEYELNELLKKVEAISTKGLTKDLINRCKILNAAKHFSSGIFQNYLVFIPAKKQTFQWHYSNSIWKSNGMSEKSIENVTK